MILSTEYLRYYSDNIITKDVEEEDNQEEGEISDSEDREIEDLKE